MWLVHVNLCCIIFIFEQASNPGPFTENNVQANVRGQAQLRQPPHPQQQQAAQAAVGATEAIGRIGLSRTASGHRRSNSYGQQHHRALTATTSCGAGAQVHKAFDSVGYVLRLYQLD